MIKKEGSKYVLMSKDGNKKLGSFDTREEAEDREKEINRIKRSASMVITKAVSKADGSLHWQAVCSDTGTDRTGERTSLILFKDWIERAENGSQVNFLPPADVPFLGLSHYPSLEGKGEAGPTTNMYVDGEVFKAKGVFYSDDDHPLGRLMFDAIAKEQALIEKGENPEQPIRISAAWYDLAHSHGAFVFERKSLTDRCPMCKSGASDKVYMRGQLDHFAATRVPINPRTSLGLEEKGMTITRKDDALSIVDDPAIVEEIDKEAKAVGKAELVVKADEEMSNMPLGGSMSLREADDFISSQEQASEVFSNYARFSTVMQNILERSEPNELKANVSNLISEFGNRVKAIKSAVEDAFMVDGEIVINEGVINMSDNTSENDTHPVDEFKEKYDEIMAMNDRTAQLEALTEAFNGLGQTAKAQVDGANPGAGVEAAIERGFTTVLERLALMQQQQASPQQQQPVQKSIAPSPSVIQATNNELPISPVTGKPSSLTAQVNRSVGMGVR